MNTAGHDVQDILDGSNLGVGVALGVEPTDPDDCITLYDIGGGEQDPKFALDYTRIQVRSRNTDYQAAYKQLEAVKLVLEGRPSGMINGTQYVGFYVASNIAFLMIDTRDRAIFTMTIRITRQPMGTDAGFRQPTSS